MRRLLLCVPLLISACAAAPQSAMSSANTAANDVRGSEVKIINPDTTPQVKFDAWKADFTNRALAKGYDPALVIAVIAPAELREDAIASNDSQPEFTKPVWSYIDNAMNERRLNGGMAQLTAHEQMFNNIERDFGVDRHTLTAIWGLESAYGDIQGNYDAISALASFAFDGRRQKFGETQLFAILDLLANRKVRQDQLVSSWAGAMGMTQFIPSTFRDYAVDYNADGNIDLWNSPEDALASAANYLSKSGWRRGEPVMTEIIFAPDFNFALSDGRKMTVSEWRALGVSPVGGGAFTSSYANMPARLYVPAGSRGPAFLTFKNFDAIKRYNNSSSYVTGITSLATGLSGQRLISRPWPKDDKPLSLSQKKNMQTALTALGYDTQGVDGQIGPNSRKAIRAWQAANGLAADGYIEQTLYARIVVAAGLLP
ncbi:lytic murein transglycosylase [Robiginitomaculum antarcticum]|uniref:lytic murein transglycosylase n=1 Tax=Robiginitomaculum antarcticum TaxID=437507 RepID=UPI0003A0B982|nr:lytic murein transglycosylase [Robiginitomaculum antarcticum]